MPSKVSSLLAAKVYSRRAKRSWASDQRTRRETVPDTFCETSNHLEKQPIPFSYLSLLSPGGRYLIREAFCKAAIVSSTVSNGVVCRELSAPPAVIAIAVAAIETLSGASHKLYAS